MKVYNPNIKKPNQNLFDFVLQNYGSLDGLSEFLKSYSNVEDFEFLAVGTVIKTPNAKPNDNKNFIQGNRIVIATGSGVNSLLGDFNDDFNNDFNS